MSSPLRSIISKVVTPKEAISPPEVIKKARIEKLTKLLNYPEPVTAQKIVDFKKEKMLKARWNYGTFGFSYCKKKLFDEKVSSEKKVLYFLGAVTSGLTFLCTVPLSIIPFSPIMSAMLIGSARKRKDLNAIDNEAIKAKINKRTHTENLDELNKGIISNDPYNEDTRELREAMKEYRRQFLAKYPDMKNSQSIVKLDKQIDKLTGIVGVMAPDR